MRVPPPLDVHAHVAPDIDGRELRALDAHVFAMTRSVAEYSLVADRHDVRTQWALGTHPGLVRINKSFDAEAFKQAASQATVIGEIGLDGSSRVPMPDQVQVFRRILEAVQEQPRVLSVHSAGAHFHILRELHRIPLEGVILHWWNGSDELTDEAVRLGCYFSMPPAMMSSLDVIGRIPVTRILPETDHPSGDRRTRGRKRPGGVAEVEKRLAQHYGLTESEMRIQFWRNLRTLLDDVGVRDHLGAAWQSVFDHLG